MDILERLYFDVVECSKKVSKDLSVPLEDVLSVGCSFIKFKLFDEPFTDYKCFPQKPYKSKDYMKGIISKKDSLEDEDENTRKIYRLASNEWVSANFEEILDFFINNSKEEDWEFINDYISSSYSYINEGMRDSKKFNEKSKSYQLFKEIPPSDTEMICFRFMRRQEDPSPYEKLEPGEVYKEYAFSSVSTTPKTFLDKLKERSEETEYFLMRIFVPKGVKYIPILTCWENELILQPQIKFMFLCENKMTYSYEKRGKDIDYNFYVKDFLVIDFLEL